MGAQTSTIPAPSIPAVVAAKPSSTTEKPKPCCVCKDEKSRRDECMLFSKAADSAEDCKSTIVQYKLCMEGFGFKV